MKNFFETPRDWVNRSALAFFFCASVGIGLHAIRLADRLGTPSGKVAQAEMAADAQPADPREELQQSSPTKFVQEPSSRLSFRPDFSSIRRQANQRSNHAMLRAFSESVAEARKSTVLLTSGKDQIALGAIVSADGWLATKASQLPSSGEVKCFLFDQSQWPAEIVQRVVELDLALLKIECNGLTPVEWETDSLPPRGAWLATTDIEKAPSAVGVVSAGMQSVYRSNAVLGVVLTEGNGEATVKSVLLGTGAYNAGLRVGDKIVSVNGSTVTSYASFQKAITPSAGGELVSLTVSRGERVFQTEVQLMDLSDELLDETEMEVNGPVSARATGFNRVFLHDTVLEPNQCGGPLCNLDGRVVGLNIARASRVSSYALPVDVVRPVIENLIEQARLVSVPAKQSPQQPADVGLFR